MVGDDVDDAAPQHWRMRQQHRISVQLQWDELYLMKRILVAWMISMQLQWDEVYLMNRILLAWTAQTYWGGLKVDPVPSDPVLRNSEGHTRPADGGSAPRYTFGMRSGEHLC